MHACMHEYCIGETFRKRISFKKHRLEADLKQRADFINVLYRIWMRRDIVQAYAVGGK